MRKLKKRKTKSKRSCGLGQTMPEACDWKLKTFKHNDKRPWGGKFTASKDSRTHKRWYVLLGPGGEHRQFFQKCLAERVGAGLCAREGK